MRVNANATPDDIDIVSLWVAVRRGLPRLLLFTFAAGAVTFVVLSTMAPRYTSEAQIAIVAKTTNPFPDARDKPATDGAASRMDKEAINTQVRALLSTDLLLRVANKLQLGSLAEFNPRLGDLDLYTRAMRLAGLAKIRDGETVDDTVLATIGRQLEVSSPKESRAINIRFTSADPALAATFANILADDYRATLVSDTVAETSAVVNAIEPKVDQLRRELIDAEAEVERTRVQIDRTAGGQQRTPLIDQRLADLTAELSRADAQKSDAESKWRGAKEMLQSGTAASLPEAQKSPLIQNLEQQRVRLERNISELSASLLPGHPRMQQLNADLAGLKRQITAEIQKLTVSVEKESRVATLRVDAIQKQINDLKGRVISTSGDDAKLRSIEASARSKRSELERLQKQLEDNKTVVVTKAVPIEARMVTQARPSSAPTFPKKAPFSMLAMAGSFLLGLAWMVTRELLVGARRNWDTSDDGGLRRSTAPAARGPEPDLGRLAPPRGMTAGAGAATAAAFDDLREQVVQASGVDAVRLSSIETLAKRLVAASGQQGGYRSMVAPADRPVDASGEAIAIVKALANAGKQVVLVDWSFDGNGFSTALSAEVRPGITELLHGDASFEDVIGRVPDSDAHYIGCGGALAEPVLIEDANRLNLVLDALDEAYDHIVVCCGFNTARALFLTIEGRFDAGVTVTEAARRQALMEQDPGTFLGFEVTGLDIISFERSAGGVAKAAPVQRATGDKAIGAFSAEFRP